jgi:uncharacterized OB-fold protein
VGPIAPFTRDADTGGFFEAAANGRLALRECAACASFIHPPTTHCPKCGSWDTHWRTTAGTGRLHSWTTVTHQIHPAYPTPFTLVVVAVDDAPGVRLIGSLPGAPELHENQAMRAVFEALPGGSIIPQWIVDVAAESP